MSGPETGRDQNRLQQAPCQIRRRSVTLAGTVGTKKDCEETERRVRIILARLKLELHPDKTRRVELSWGKQGFDFLGCHLRKRLSGPIWERERKPVYFLQRWPSQRSMKRIRQRVKELTGRKRGGVKDGRVLIKDITPVLRGWGNYYPEAAQC